MLFFKGLFLKGELRTFGFFFKYATKKDHLLQQYLRMESASYSISIYIIQNKPQTPLEDLTVLLFIDIPQNLEQKLSKNKKKIIKIESKITNLNGDYCASKHKGLKQLFFNFFDFILSIYLYFFFYYR